MTKYILTHASKAHLDEALGTIFLCEELYKKGIEEISLTRSNDEAICDDYDYVIDMGKKYNPQGGRFDHHHDAKLQCSLGLIAEHFNSNILDSGAYQTINKKDLYGPKQMGLSSEQQAFLGNFESLILQEFSQIKEEVVSKDALWYKLGKSLLEKMGNEVEAVLKAKEVLSKGIALPNNGLLIPISTTNSRITDVGLKTFDYIVMQNGREKNSYSVICDTTKNILTKEMGEWSFLHNNGFLGVIDKDKFEPSTILKKNKLEVIGIAGEKRSGKSFLAKTIKKALEEEGKKVKLLAFADPIKKVLELTMDISSEELEQNKNAKEIISFNGKQMDFRTILQRFGVEAMQSVFGKDVWIDKMAEQINKTKNEGFDCILIQDLRTPEELNFLQRLEKENEISTSLIKVIDMNTQDSTIDQHATESQIKSLKIDTVFYNDKKIGTVEDFVRNLREEKETYPSIKYPP